jgi:hypothetical protein
VDVDGLGGIGDRGRWSRLGGERGEEEGELGEDLGGEVVFVRLGEEALRGAVGQAVLGGEGLDRFA